MNAPKTEKRPFEIVVCDAPGQPPRIVESLEAEVIVHGDDVFLTLESRALSERVRTRDLGLFPQQ